jgi:hypothetical protein
MRRLFAFCILAGVVTLLGASVAAAASPSVGAEAEAASASVAEVARPRLNFNNTGLRDEAAMVLVGTILIGLAGAVRRAA